MLNSPRFWQLAIIGLSVGLAVAFPASLLVKGLAAAVGVWFGGSVVVRTVDRASDKKVEAAQVV